MTNYSQFLQIQGINLHSREDFEFIIWCSQAGYTLPLDECNVSQLETRYAAFKAEKEAK